jgi:hypothetical protein
MALNDNSYLTTRKVEQSDSERGLQRKLLRLFNHAFPDSHEEDAVTITSNSVYTKLVAAAAEKVTIFNDTGVSIDVRRVGLSIARTMADGTALDFDISTARAITFGASDIEVKRNSGSGNVDVKYTRHYNA